MGRLRMKEATPPSSIAAPLGFTLNGTAVTVPVPDPDVTALDVLRDRLGRTEVKRVCDGGACGACTVLLGEAPVVTCLLPAARLAGSAVRTVAGLGPDLHPVQRALLDHDGLQCGFCTPGFVMSAVGFVDSWRASRGDVRPDRDTVAEALAGNLCRCGAYAGILTAVAEACTGRYDTDPDTAEQPTRNGARARVTGQARYTADLFGDGVLRGGLVRSERAHARIGEVDLGPARRLPGVFAAVELLQPDRVVRYHGQEVAAVAAVDTATLRRALDLVQVTYQPLPAVVGRQAPGGPAVYPPKHRGVPRTGEATLPVPARRRGNLYGPVRVFSRRRRRAARLLRERAGHYVAGVWTTSGQSHTPFEPHCCVAEWGGDRLTVHTSTQMVGMAARLLARHCSVPDANVTVLAEHVGGGFGAKLEITPETVAAVELARVARRPVGVVLDRAEELAYGGQRSAAEIEVDLLAAPEPERSALRVRAMSYGGIAVGSQVASLCRSSYPRLAKDLQDFNVVDNSPPAKPFRGPGGPVMCWALEQAVDEAAYGMGADPVDLRYGWTDDPAMRRLYQTARTQPRWRDRPPPGTARGRVRRGIGVAAAHWVYYAHADTRIRVSVVDGYLVAATATQDTATGAADRRQRRQRLTGAGGGGRSGPVAGRAGQVVYGGVRALPGTTRVGGRGAPRRTDRVAETPRQEPRAVRDRAADAGPRAVPTFPAAHRRAGDRPGPHRSRDARRGRGGRRARPGTRAVGVERPLRRHGDAAAAGPQSVPRRRGAGRRSCAVRGEGAAQRHRRGADHGLRPLLPARHRRPTRGGGALRGVRLRVQRLARRGARGAGNAAGGRRDRQRGAPRHRLASPGPAAASVAGHGGSTAMTPAWRTKTLRAGGTDLTPLRRSGIALGDVVDIADLPGCPELVGGTRRGDGALRIG